MEEEKSTNQLSRELACMLGQHEWIVDPDDIRFRECLFCECTEYLGKRVTNNGQSGRSSGSPRRRK